MLEENPAIMDPQPVLFRLRARLMKEQVKKEVFPSMSDVTCLLGVAESDDIDVARGVPVASRS